VAYRAEIEIGIKGAARLKDLQNRLQNLATLIDKNNKKPLFDRIAVQSVNEYAAALSTAKRNLDQVRIELDGAGKATGNYAKSIREFVTALGASNEAQKITNNLIDQEISARTQATAALKAYNAAAAAPTQRGRATTMSGAYLRGAYRGETQYTGGIGPGAASSTALSSPTALFSPLPARSAFGTDQSLVGQSSAVGGRVARLKAVQDDELKLQQALFALNKKTAEEKNKQVDAQEALVRGANEVKALVAEARGETISSSIDNRSPARRQKEDRTRRAENIAKEAALKSKANQEEFAALKKYQDELFNIERSFIRNLRNEKIDAVLEAAEIEGKKQDELLERIKRNNKEGLDDFDRRLKVSVDKRKARGQDLTLTGQTSPIGGATNIPGSPAARRRTARNTRLQGAASNAIIGGAFPLLFGQGIGASVGGAAGGGLGGLAGGQFGFGLSLVGTAIGTAVDTLIAKAGDLGKALNPLTADIGALADAAGLAGTENGKLIKSLESFIGSEKALQLASQQLAVIVGQDGVQALKDYGDANTDLSNQLSKAFTDLSASIAPFLSQVTGAIAGRVETTRLVKRGVNEFSSDPAIKKAQNEFLQGKIREFELEQKIADVVRQKEAALQRAADSQLQSATGSRINLQIAEQELVIEQGRDNLLDARVQKSKKDLILLKASQEAQAIISQEDKKQLTSAQAQLKFQELNLKNDRLKLQLQNAITKAKEDQLKQLERENQAAARRAAAEAKRVQRELEARNRGLSSAQVGSMQSLIAGSRAGLQSTRVFEGEKAFLEESEKALEYEVRLKTRILDIQYKQRASQAKSQKEAEHLFNTYNTQYDTIERIYFTQLQQVRQQKEQLRVQKEINALQQAEETAGIERGFTRNIADVERRIASPFGGDDSDMLNLRIEQLRRTEDVYRDIDTQVSILNKKLEADPSNEIIADNIKGLEERKQKLEELLPVLDQVEQAELRQNQALEKFGFIADEAATAMSSAVQSIITGTGSVKEAFSDMFANIGKAFIDMATQMIAKALVMKALGILTSALGGGGGGGGGFNPNAPSITGNSIGNFGGGSFGGFMANGGPVNANTPYIVGERGPELMIPSSQGRIVSNENLRSEMDRSTATQSAMSRNSPAATIDVRYSVERINNVDYVTAGEFQQGMAQAAKQGAIQGEQRAMRTLKNSASTRRSVGF